METCLRVMNSQDTKAVMALEAACFSDPCTWGIIKDLPDSPWDETWLLEDERGTLLGYLTCRFLAGEGELMRIAVFPEFRGQGYSRELMDRMEKSAAEKAVNALSLEVRAGNEVALGLYQSYGFREEARRKNYYQQPVEDAVIMWLRNIPVVST